jgi:serine/threonine-protein kinase RsbW
MMEQKFRREISSLHQIFDFLHEFLRRNKIAESNAFTIDLVVEELFTNMVKYHPEGADEILIHVEKRDNKLVVDLVDFDCEPFDLTQTEEVNIDIPLDQRRVGGLGIHLVKKMVDHLEYHYDDGNAKITFMKNLEK